MRLRGIGIKMQGMTKKELKEEDCREYEFLVLDNLHECAEIVEIQAGSEDDAWELLNEGAESNYENNFLLTPKFKKELKKVLNSKLLKEL